MRSSLVRSIAIFLLAALACGRGAQDRRELAAAATGGGGPAVLVGDLRVAPLAQGSSPSDFTVVLPATPVYFTADAGDTGRELWRTDGSPGGTVLAADILPGEGSSSPSSMVGFDGAVLFAANDGSRGAELWRSDDLGTRLLRDLWPGSRGSSPRHLTVAGGRVFFAAETAGGIGLWKTDGTFAGTAPIAAAGGTDPSALGALGSTLFFAGDGGPGVGVELWRTDGTEAGTTLVQDIHPSGSSAPHGFTEWNGRLYFAATTPAGVRLHSIGAADGAAQPVGADETITDPSLLTPFAGSLGAGLYYRAVKGGVPNLFSTTGSSQQQQTGVGGRPDLDPTALAAVGGTLFVSGRTAGEGHELFSWNGVALQTHDLVPGSGASAPAELAAVGGKLLFAALAPSSGVRSLWVVDPTVGVPSVLPMSGATVEKIASFGTEALVSADDGAQGAELWKSDGSPAGTARVKNLRPDLSSSDPADLTSWGGRLYFSASGEDLDLVLAGRELFASDGTSAGTGLVWDVYLGTANGEVGSLADGGAASPGCNLNEQWTCSGGLLFAAFTEPSGRELWRWGGVQVTPVPVLEVNALEASASPAELTPLGAVTFFTADDGVAGRELWRTDGSRAGTALVANLRTGGSSLPYDLTPAAGLLYFAATQDGVDFRPYRSDGTGAGTHALPQVSSLIDPISAPSRPVALGPVVLFAATTGPNDELGRELFRYDPAAGPLGTTTLVRDLYAGPGSADPTSLAVHSGEAYLGASDGSGVGLWRTDGTFPGTSLVRTLGALGAGEVGSAVSVGGKLLFVANDEAIGHELWTSDGTAGGTRLTRDVHPGPVGSATGSVLFPLPTRGHVLYAASDGLSGRELWISNGTDLGTRLLQDVRPGAASSNPRGFFALGELVFFTADDGVAGRELWLLDVSPAALDLTPPVPGAGGVCAPISVEATGPGGARPTAEQLFVAAVDDVSAPAAITRTYEPPAGSLFPLGATGVVATFADEAGNLARCAFDVSVVDTTAPSMTCPATFVAEATGPSGAPASYPAATAADAVTAAPTVGYSQAAGSLFPLGDTLVTATGTDAAGNAGTCTFTVRVVDTTAPAVTCPAGPTAPATGLSGAVVTYGPATATDAVSSSPVLSYSHASGSTFPLGATTVTATATDDAGNAGTCTFTVTVQDTTPPSVTCPPSVSLEATSPSGAAATWGDAVAADLETAPASLVVTYGPARGSTFPLGTSTVTATATDLGGNTDACTFTVTVTDTLPPSVTCPVDVVAEATGAAGAPVTYPGALASDVATASPAVAYVLDGTATPAPPGSVFPLGATTVRATATDGAGLTATCTFVVSVHDTTAPLLDCPAVVAEATGPDPDAAVVTFAATASDLVTAAPTVTHVPASGSAFPLGTTDVAVTAQDAVGNVSSCTFPVTVRDTTPPNVTCPGDLTVEATGPGGAPVALSGATATDAVTAALAVAYAPPSDATLPLGPNVVTASASDAALNTGSCTFTVTVADTTPPSIVCPAAATVQVDRGAPVVLPAATATDLVTLSPGVSSVPHTGSVLPEGTTQVSWTATDGAGNRASCSTSVTVQFRPAAEPPPEGGCGCGSGGGGALALGALLALWLRPRRREG
jgi:MYXO-CTERM domain-containing protein